MGTPSIIGEIDERLREAAKSGNVEFLRECVADNRPNDYYLTLFDANDDYDYGNIFHIALKYVQEDWISEAIESLPVEVVHQLLCQPRSVGDNSDKQNPLHMAAKHRSVMKIVKMFLNAFSSSSLLPPWLMKNENGETPCHVALSWENEECGLEILGVDKEKLCNMVDNDGWSLLYHAVCWGLDKVAMEIVTSSHSFSASGPGGENALHVVANCSSSERGKDICRSLIKKVPELIKQKTNYGLSAFHKWAFIEKIWPFQCILDSNDILPDLRHMIVDLISVKDNEGANPLHYLAKNSSTSKDGVQIGKLLIDTYKWEQEAHGSPNVKSLSTALVQYPWLVRDNEKKTPLDYAMDKKDEEFANLLLTEDKYSLITCQKNVLFMAIDKRFEEVQLKILEIVEQGLSTRVLTNGQKLNALHLAPMCKSK